MTNYKLLKQKVSKTLKSMKYTVMNKKMTSTELTDYLGQTERGLSNIFKTELKEYIVSYCKKIPININVKGRAHGIVPVSLNAIYPVDKIDEEKFQTELYPKLCGYLETFISDIKKDPANAVTESYVDAVITEFVNKLDESEAKLIKKHSENSPIYGELEVISLKRT